MSIDVYVSTQDIDSISIEDTVELTLRRRTGDIEFHGIVVQIDSTAVVRLSALGVEERKVKVRIEPQLPDDVEIGLGHALDVTFSIFREEGRIVVPRTAVFIDNGQDMVWAVRGGDSGRIESLPVVTGIELRSEIIIESGLEEGDYVIIDANNPDLKVGKRVTNG
jgi:HlyD family secretion protein